MTSFDPLFAPLGGVTVALLIAGALLLPAFFGRGPLARRAAEMARRRDDEKEARPAASPVPGVAISTSVQLLARKRRSRIDGDSAAQAERAVSEELDDVLQGALRAESINHAIRVIAYAFIFIVLAIVSLSQLWRPVQPLIFATLMLAGLFVLIVHEVLPASGLGNGRIFVESTAAVVFLTALVLLTGNAASPFFFLLALLVGGVGLVASPIVTLILAVEAVVALVVSALWTEGGATRDSLARVAINLSALLALSWASLAIAQVQRRTREAAIRLSTVDSLTNLSNRAYFFNVVEREIQRSRRFGRSFCLLMMDLDGLKTINDRHGHFGGDMVLRGVSHVIRTGLRGVDLAARYGGDEFVAMLPETDTAGAFVAAEKIRAGVSEMLVEGDGEQLRTSLSIGVVSYPEDGHTVDELLIAADEAMYAAKRLGKNRVVGYGEPGENTSPLMVQRRPVTTPGFRPLMRDVDFLSERPRERGEHGPEDLVEIVGPPDKETDDADGPGKAVGPGKLDERAEADEPPMDGETGHPGDRKRRLGNGLS